MQLHRLSVEDFERTQPVVHPQRGDAHPEKFSGIPDRWDEPEQVDQRAEAQHSVICGDTAWDRAVIALCIVGVIAALAVLSGCGGGDPEPTWPEGVNVRECSLSPDKKTLPTYLLDLYPRCVDFVTHQCRTGRRSAERLEMRMSHIVGSYWLRTRGAAKRIRSLKTKPGLIARLWRWWRAAHLRWEIQCDEDWLAQWRLNGHEDDVLRRRVGEKRVQLALLEAGR